MDETLNNSTINEEDVEVEAEVSKQKTAVYLTTIDNPFNPHTQWDEWKRFDEDHDYYSLQYLARIAKTSHELTDSENLRAIEEAVDEICKFNIIGLYRKIVI